jgi:hypothetical protein
MDSAREKRLKGAIIFLGVAQLVAFLIASFSVSFEPRLALGGAIVVYMLFRADLFFWQRVAGERAWFFHFNVPAAEPFGILDVPMLAMLICGTLLLVFYIPVFGVT